MNCPKCKGYHLKPQKLDNGLVALSCDNCNGALLSIVQFIQWRATQKSSDVQSSGICEIDETSQLLHCLKCAGFMTKYKISNQTHNRLDLCFRCYETWIDSGEWQLLQQLDLYQRLDDIFSDQWQNHLLHNPNPDIENTIRAQPLSTPNKSKKCLTTNKVATYFLDSLYVPSDSTLFHVSISGLG